MSPKTALVIRATGTQGQAVIHHLLSSHWTVHALVRDPLEARAIALQKSGAILFPGTLDDKDAITKAVAGCSALFLNQMPSFTDPHQEPREAKLILEAAKEAGVTHVVHSTALTLTDPNFTEKYSSTLIGPSILGKASVENLVRQSGIQFWTILRGGYFMSNLIAPSAAFMFPDLGAKHEFISSFTEDTRLPLIDPYDIGAFAKAAFEDPEKFHGKEIGLAGENLGVREIVGEMERVSGKEIKVVWRDEEETERLNGRDIFVTSQVLSRDLAGLVDVEDIRGWGVPLTSFAEFVEKHKDKVLGTEGFGAFNELVEDLKKHVGEK